MPLVSHDHLSGVYALLPDSGEGVYVGSSTNIDRRIQWHFQALRDGYHHAKKLQALFDAGIAFDVAVLERCQRDQCVVREQYWMDRMGPLLNTSRFAACAMFDPAIAAKVGDANRGKVLPGVGASNKLRIGKPWTPRNREQWIANLVATKTGQKFGKRPPEVGQKIAAALRGQPLSAERREKIRQAHLLFHQQLRAQGLVQRRPRAPKDHPPCTDI